MKKAALILMLGTFAMSAGIAKARAGTVHISMDVCYVLAGDCSSFAMISDGMVVAASNSGANWSVRCHGRLAAGTPLPTGQAARCTAGNTGGTPCETVFGDTTDWQEIVSPSGRVSLICHGTN
jgi:hypothetical protein